MSATTNPLPDRLKRFAVRIIRLCEALPEKNVGWVIGKQVLKSGTSIGANYYEALRASSRPHFISILEIALREAAETKYWLELMVEADIFTARKLAGLQSECEELIRILAATVKTSKRSSGKTNSEI